MSENAPNINSEKKVEKVWLSPWMMRQLRKTQSPFLDRGEQAPVFGDLVEASWRRDHQVGDSGSIRIVSKAGVAPGAGAVDTEVLQANLQELQRLTEAQSVIIGNLRSLVGGAYADGHAGEKRLPGAKVGELPGLAEDAKRALRLIEENQPRTKKRGKGSRKHEEGTA